LGDGPGVAGMIVPAMEELMKILLLIAVGLLAVQEDPENPEYKRWSSCKVGSWVKYKSDIVAGENKTAIPQEMTWTLLELDDKKAVVEETLVNLQAPQGAGQEKPRKRTYRAKGGKKEKVEKEGDEELEVAGKKLACHWTLVTPPSTSGGSAKTWVSPEVPGGVVKAELNFPGLGGMQRMTATGWEKK
jgi:hypothetical protein